MKIMVTQMYQKNMRYLIIISFTLLLAQEMRLAQLDTATNGQMVLVPNVSGYRYEQAIDTLMKLGLSLGESAGVASRHEPGHVIRQAPPAGAVVPVETPFNLWVSSGQRITDEETVAVPSPRGRRVEEEEAVNKDVDLRITTTDQYRIVIVPLVVGQKLQQAKNAIEREQLVVGKIDEEFNEGDPGTVIRQTPRGETRARVNTPVDLVVAAGRTNLLPWIIGGSLFALGVGGYLAYRHMANGSLPRPQVRFKPKRDFGEHQIDSKDTLQSGLEIGFLPITDFGIQTIDIEGSLIIDERGVDE